MDVVDITLPALEPVSLPRAKLFLRVEHDAEDALILDMIRAARIRVETYVGSSLIERQRRLTYDRFEKNIFINHHPIQSIQDIRYVSQDGQQQVLTPQQYKVNLRSRPAKILIDETVWPLFSKEGHYHLEIDIIAGYGPADTDVPMPFIQAILLLLAQTYERREALGTELPMMVQALLMPYRGLSL